MLPEVFQIAFLHLGRRPATRKRRAQPKSVAVAPVSGVYAPRQLDSVQQFFDDMEWSSIQGKRAVFVREAFASAETKFLIVLYCFLINGNEFISAWCQKRIYDRYIPPLWDALWKSHSVIWAVMQFAASLLSHNSANPVCDILVHLAGVNSFSELVKMWPSLVLAFRSVAVALSVSVFLRSWHRINQLPCVISTVADGRRDMEDRRRTAHGILFRCAHDADVGCTRKTRRVLTNIDSYFTHTEQRFWYFFAGCFCLHSQRCENRHGQHRRALTKQIDYMHFCSRMINFEAMRAFLEEDPLQNVGVAEARPNLLEHPPPDFAFAMTALVPHQPIAKEIAPSVCRGVIQRYFRQCAQRDRVNNTCSSVYLPAPSIWL